MAGQRSGAVENDEFDGRENLALENAGCLDKLVAIIRLCGDLVVCPT
jgi:hypothetical protein